MTEFGILLAGRTSEDYSESWVLTQCHACRCHMAIRNQAVVETQPVLGEWLCEGREVGCGA